MRSRAILLGVAALTGIAGRWAHGEDAKPLASVRVDVQMVSVSVPEAVQLVPAFQQQKTAEAAWARVQTMIAHGEARLLAWPVLWLRNGSSGETKSVDEHRYPTVFDPPAGSGGFGRIPIPLPTWGPSTPTAFETRNVGCTLEAEATVEPGGQKVMLNLHSEYVRAAAGRQWLIQRSPLGIAGVQQMPAFQTSRITTQLYAYRDQPALVGVFVFSEPEPHVELSILHARATLLPPSAAPPSPTK